MHDIDTEYNITYENLLGAENTNPLTYSESSLPLFFESPGRIDGRLFAGWFPHNLGGDYVLLIPPGTVGDVVLYARWVMDPDTRRCRCRCNKCRCGHHHEHSAFEQERGLDDLD